MTLSFIIISIVAFIFFEYGKISKLNPILSKSEITYANDNKKVKLNNEKMWVPFRLATYEEQFIDHRGILYPIIYYVKGTKNKENAMDLEFRTLKCKL